MKRALLVLGSMASVLYGGCVVVKGAQVYESLTEGTGALIGILTALGIIT